MLPGAIDRMPATYHSADSQNNHSKNLLALAAAVRAMMIQGNAVPIMLS